MRERLGSTIFEEEGSLKRNELMNLLLQFVSDLTAKIEYYLMSEKPQKTQWVDSIKKISFNLSRVLDEWTKKENNLKISCNILIYFYCLENSNFSIRDVSICSPGFYLDKEFKDAYFFLRDEIQNVYSEARLSIKHIEF